MRLCPNLDQPGHKRESLDIFAVSMLLVWGRNGEKSWQYLIKYKIKKIKKCCLIYQQLTRIVAVPWPVAAQTTSVAPYLNVTVVVPLKPGAGLKVKDPSSWTVRVPAVLGVRVSGTFWGLITVAPMRSLYKIPCVALTTKGTPHFALYASSFRYHGHPPPQ